MLQEAKTLKFKMKDPGCKRHSHRCRMRNGISEFVMKDTKTELENNNNISYHINTRSTPSSNAIISIKTAPRCSKCWVKTYNMFCGKNPMFCYFYPLGTTVLCNSLCGRCMRIVGVDLHANQVLATWFLIRISRLQSDVSMEIWVKALVWTRWSVYLL